MLLEATSRLAFVGSDRETTHVGAHDRSHQADFFGRAWGARQRKTPRDIERCRETKPLIGTQMAAFRQVMKTSRPTFQGGSTGSNPVGATTKKCRSAATFASPASCVVIFGTRMGRKLNRQQSVQAAGQPGEKDGHWEPSLPTLSLPTEARLRIRF